MTLAIISICINAGVIILLYIKLSKEIRKSGTYDYVLSEIRKDVDDLVVQINQTAERNISLIEDRISKISALIVSADKRIKLLDKKPVPLYNDIRKTVVPDVKQTRNDQKISKKEQVLELHRNGFAPGIIAAKVGITIGEVELIISLASGKEER